MIRVGIGGWTYEPWRGLFFPPGLPHARELEHASAKLRTIEVNGTFYRSQTPATFAKWAAETPDGFVFVLKAPRYAVNRRVLADAGESIGRFVDNGIGELGDKLGPILWQFAPTKTFDREDFARFLALLPAAVGARPLRHAVEVRHASFEDARFEALARDHGVAVVVADSDAYPLIEVDTSDFTYARLLRARPEVETGYTPDALDTWSARAAGWGAGGDAFVYMINGAKERAPAAAMALQARV